LVSLDHDAILWQQPLAQSLDVGQQAIQDQARQHNIDHNSRDAHGTTPISLKFSKVLPCFIDGYSAYLLVQFILE